MFSVELFVPLADNDGQKFSFAHHLVFETKLVDLFGGCTRLPGTVAGTWADDGVAYKDDLVIYMVALSSLLEGDKVRTAVKFALVHYEQEAIFLRYLGLAEIVE